MQGASSQQQLKTASLGVADIVFFVVAAAAPLGATLGVAPVVFASAGAGAPGVYLLASVILLLFAIGFAAMSKHVVSAGGFAAMATKGLGTNIGNAAAGIAVFAYVAMLTGIYGQFAGFSVDTLSSLFGLNVDWWIVVVVVIGVIALFGYHDVNMSAKVLGVLMILEVLILVIFDIAVIAQTEVTDFTVSTFIPTSLVTPGIGIALMFAFCCFVGFESTTIYGEEASDPSRTIPMATYVSIGIIGVFYTFTMWSLGLAYGHMNVQNAASTNMINFVFDANTKFVGEWSTKIMKILVLTSIFAVLLSFHNALCRYSFALSRSKFLPKSLSNVHPKHSSPHIASVCVTFVSLLIVGVFAIADADPILQLFMWMVGIGTLTVLVLQTIGAASVIGFTIRTRKIGFWQGIVASSIGGMGLAVVVYLAVANFDELTGAKTGLVTHLPWLVVVAAVIGYLNGLCKASTPKTGSVAPLSE
ncbi:Amino acid transporter [Pseudomonas sp. NFACC15-1]|uniref:APC family permease n=1 Tax=unclassified Pseudomonas TaxID=196821 RepID=UPI00088690F7|nr:MULTISPECIES: APC family permease [unclassified Pseudomonas]SDA92048.1 Amino acid transporter [Pseudomonas sp. NFACC15-1]SDY71444.1 Amino acid transporter [Pseudomonas sp. NFACC14]